MKQILKDLLIASLLATILMAFDGCHKPSEGPKNACKLTQIVSTGDSSNGNVTLDYDANGQVVNVSYSTEENNSDQVKSKYSTSVSYEYDINGYLIKAPSETVYLKGSEDVSKTTSNTVYEYQNSQLVKLTEEINLGASLTYLVVFIYDYDASGKLIKYSVISTSSNLKSSTIYDFKTQEVTMTSYGGIVTKGELDAEGYVIKEVNSAGVERRYQYDGEGNLIRKEEWTKGKMDNATVYEYDNKINPTSIYYGAPTIAAKGIPYLKIYRTIIPIHNYTKETNFDVDNQGKEVIVSTKLYGIQYNTSGYPIHETLTESNATGAVISTANASYTYKDCQ